MKKLLLFTFALFLWTGAWADKTIYLNPAGFSDNGNNWASGNAVFAAWVWIDGSNGRWIIPTSKFTKGGTTYYKFIVSDDENRIIFNRADSYENAKSWKDDGDSDHNPWNSTGTIDISSSDLVTITGWDSNSTPSTLNPYGSSTFKTIYLYPGTWYESLDAVSYAVHTFIDSNNSDWFAFTQVPGTKAYSAQIPSEYTGMVIARLPENVMFDFSNCYNQTNDYVVGEANTIYVIDSWNGGDAWPGHSNKSTAHTSTNLALLGTASASINDGTAGDAIDGNNGTRWGSGVDGRVDADWFQVKWTTAQTFNTIRLLCENAMNTANAPHLAFDIQTSDNGTDWTTQRAVSGKNAGNNEYITAQFVEPVTAKYVRFQGVKQGNYGYSFFEFEVYNYADPLVLSSINIAANRTSVKTTKTATFTVSGKDQLDGVMTPAFLTWESTNTSVGKVEEFDGKYIFTAETVGETTITAKGNSGTLSSNTITMTVETLPVPTDVPSPIKGVNNVSTVYSQLYGNATGLNLDGDWKKTEVNINGKKAEKIENFVYGYFVYTGKDVSSMEKIHFDIYPSDNMSTIGIRVIGTDADGYYRRDITLGEWNSFDVDLVEDLKLGGKLTNITRVLFVKDINGTGGNINGDKTEEFYVGNVYFWKAATKPYLNVNPGNTTVVIGYEGAITPKVYNVDETDITNTYDISYSSDNPDVLSVDTDGSITASSPGTATVTVTATKAEAETLSEEITFTVVLPEPKAPEESWEDVLVVFSKTYHQGNDITNTNGDWGTDYSPSGVKPLNSNCEFVTQENGHKVVHITGHGLNGGTMKPTELALGARTFMEGYSVINFAVWPTSATKGEVFADNNYPTTVTSFSGLTPGKWNYISVKIDSRQMAEDKGWGDKSYIVIYFMQENGTMETEFYLDHFYLTKGQPVNIGSHGYTTLISDKNLDFSVIDDLTAYRATREGTTVTLNKVGEVPANKGLVLQGTANETYYIPVLASTEETVETDLTGNATAPYELVSGKHYYVLSNVGGAEGFYHYTGSDNIPAGKAFFETDEALSTSSGADYMSIIFGDDEPSGETTRINAVNIDFANEAAYNLAGQRVGNDYKGIVIVNGKKYLRK